MHGLLVAFHDMWHRIDFLSYCMEMLTPITFECALCIHCLCNEASVAFLFWLNKKEDIPHLLVVSFFFYMSVSRVCIKTFKFPIFFLQLLLLFIKQPRSIMPPFMANVIIISLCLSFLVNKICHLHSSLVSYLFCKKLCFLPETSSFISKPIGVQNISFCILTSTHDQS